MSSALQELLERLQALRTTFHDKLTELLSPMSSALRALRERLQALRTLFYDKLIELLSACLWYGSIIIEGTRQFSRFVLYSGINIACWAIDKLIFGPPHLRAMLQGGMLPHDVAVDNTVREWTLRNAGWDVYHKNNERISDNVFGYLCAITGISLGYHLMSHSLKSLQIMLVSFYNVTNQANTDTSLQQDPRHNFIKYFTLLGTAPIWLPLISVSNLIIGCALSYYYLLTQGYNLTNTPPDKIRDWADHRPLLSQLIYGLLITPVVAPVAMISNIFLGTWQSAFINTINVARHSDEPRPLEPYYWADRRYPASRIVYGFTSLPLVVPGILLTAVIPGTLQSLRHTIRNLYSITNQDEITVSQALDDGRRVPWQIVTGILACPITIPTVLCSNLLLGIGISSKNLMQNLANITNQPTGLTSWEVDERPPLSRWFYGLLVIPLVVPLAILSNVILGTLKSAGVQITNVTRRSHNNRDQVPDDKIDSRHLASRIIYGFTSLPLVVPVILLTAVGLGTLRSTLVIISRLYSITNQNEIAFSQALDDGRPVFWQILTGVLASPITVPILVCSNLMLGMRLSGINLLRNLANITNQPAGGIHWQVDNRPPLSRWFYGLLVIPLIAPVAVLTNLLIGSSLSLYHLAFAHLLTGQSSAPQHPHRITLDRRSRTSRLVYGGLVAPIAIPLAMLTRLLVGVILSAKILTRRFGNITNQHRGVVSIEEPDTRPMALQVIYGFAVSPVVLPIVILTNITFGVSTSTYYLLRSLWDGLNQSPEETARLLALDKRFYASQFAYGLLVSPLLLPLLLLSNMVPNLPRSVFYLTTSLWNATNLPWSETQARLARDPRPRISQILHGVLVMPMVLPPLTITNLLTLTAKSAYFSLVNFANITNQPYEITDNVSRDPRHAAIAWLGQLIAAPLVIPVVIVSNTLIGMGLSWYFLTTWLFTIVNKPQGWQPPELDKRHPAARLVYGTLISPVVLPTVCCSNLVLGTATSLYYLVYNFATLTNQDPEHPTWTVDQRTPASRWLCNALALPIAGPVIIITNISCGVFLSILNFTENYAFITNRTSSRSIMWVADTRPLSSRIVYGAMALPFVIPELIITNLGVGMFLSSIHLSACLWNVTNRPWRDVTAEFAADERALLAKIGYGLIPFTTLLPVFILTNLVSGIWQSWLHTVTCYWHCLGTLGMFKEQAYYQDGRPMLARTVYGLLASPLALPVVIITNTGDALLSLLVKHKVDTLFICSALLGALLSPILIPIAFALRKSIVAVAKASYRSLDNATQTDPIKHTVIYGPHDNKKTFALGILGIVSFGVIPALYKIGKSQRLWGREKRSPDPKLASNYPSYTLMQESFQEQINQAKRGLSLQGDDWSGRARPFFRLAGFRSPQEQAIKTLHNAFLGYANSNNQPENQNAEKDHQAFVQSDFFKTAEAHIKATYTLPSQHDLFVRICKQLELPIALS